MKVAGHSMMTIYDGSESGPTSAFEAQVELIEDVFGRFVCTGCQGHGCFGKPHGSPICNLCKGTGYLWVGF